MLPSYVIFSPLVLFFTPFFDLRSLCSCRGAPQGDGGDGGGGSSGGGRVHCANVITMYAYFRLVPNPFSSHPSANVAHLYSTFSLSYFQFLYASSPSSYTVSLLVCPFHDLFIFLLCLLYSEFPFLYFCLSNICCIFLRFTICTN